MRTRCTATASSGEKLCRSFQASSVRSRSYARETLTATYMSKCSGVPSKVQFKTNTDEGEDAEAISKADRNVSISLRGEFGPLISPANSRSTPSPTGPTTRTLSVSTAIKPGFCRSLSSNPVRGCGEELRDLRSTMGSRTPVRGYRDGRQPDDGRPLPRRRNSRSRRHPLSKQSFPYHDLSARCVRPLRSARPSIRAPVGPVKKSRRPSVSPPGGLPTPSYRLPIDRNTYGLSYTVVTRRVRSLLQALLCNPAGAPSHEGFAFPETSENAVDLRTKIG